MPPGQSPIADWRPDGRSIGLRDAAETVTPQVAAYQVTNTAPLHHNLDRRTPDGPSPFDNFFVESYVTKPLYVAQLRDVQVHGGLMLLGRDDGALLAESIPTWHRDPLVYTTRTDFAAANAYEGEIDEPVALVTNYSFRNYWHWTIQCLPAIRQLERCGFLPAGRLALPPGLTGWHRRMLSLMGIDVDRQVHLPFGRVRVRHLVYPSFLEQHRFGHFSPLVYDTTDRLGRVADAAAATRPNRVYIARTDSENRVLENEAELIDALAAQGFEILLPGASGFDRQVAAVQSATEIVAPHGAGMTNICYAPRDCLVVEATPAAWAVNSFQRHAGARGQAYGLFVSDRLHGDRRGHATRWSLDLPVFLDFLETCRRARATGPGPADR